MDITVADMDDVCIRLQELRNEKAYKKIEMDRLQERIDALEQKALDLLTKTERDSYSSPFGTIYKIRHNTVRTPKTSEEKQLVAKHFEAKGLFWEYLGFNHQSLNSYFKTEVENAAQRGEVFAIPGLEESYFESIGFRKTK